MEIINKIVDFETYCKTCKYKDAEETDEPCNECLSNFTNQNSKKPNKYEMKENDKIKTQEEQELLESNMRVSKSTINVSENKPKVAMVDSEGVMNKVKEMFNNERK